MAKPTKADLVALNNSLNIQLTGARSHVARLEAELEASHAVRDAQLLSLSRQQRRIDELETELSRLQQQLTTQRRDEVVIRNRGELLQVMRRLAAEGVPCMLRGEHIYHARTKAILASITH